MITPKLLFKATHMNTLELALIENSNFTKFYNSVQIYQSLKHA